jgi:hypothetical protein
MKFDLVLAVQPSGHRAYGTGWIDAAFGVAPETTTEPIGVGSRRAMERFTTIEQLQMLAALSACVLRTVFAQDLPFVVVMSKVQ